MASDDEGKHVDEPISRWRSPTGLLSVFTLSAIVFCLTFNELLAASIPYVRAGWPAARTAVWLRFADPWRARGIVGMWFHLAMAGFSAAVAGVIALFLLMFIESQLNRPADLNQVAQVLVVILSGCALSFAFGWIGIFTALRRRVRIYIVSNLCRICGGDFSRIASLPMQRYVTNPVNFVLTIAIATPMLISWCVFLALSMPVNVGPDIPVLLVAGQLTTLALGIAAVSWIFSFVSTRIVAQTPLDCWAAPVPELMSDLANWYRPDDDHNNPWT